MGKSGMASIGAAACLLLRMASAWGAAPVIVQETAHVHNSDVVEEADGRTVLRNFHLSQEDWHRHSPRDPIPAGSRLDSCSLAALALKELAGEKPGAHWRITSIDLKSQLFEGAPAEEGWYFLLGASEIDPKKEFPEIRQVGIFLDGAVMIPEVTPVKIETTEGHTPDGRFWETEKTIPIPPGVGAVSTISVAAAADTSPAQIIPPPQPVPSPDYGFAPLPFSRGSCEEARIVEINDMDSPFDATLHYLYLASVSQLRSHLPIDPIHQHGAVDWSLAGQAALQWTSRHHSGIEWRVDSIGLASIDNGAHVRPHERYWGYAVSCHSPREPGTAYPGPPGEYQDRVIVFTDGTVFEPRVEPRPPGPTVYTIPAGTDGGVSGPKELLP